MKLTAGIRSADGTYFGPGDETKLCASPQAATVDWAQLQGLGIVIVHDGDNLPGVAPADAPAAEDEDAPAKPSRAKKGKKGA